MISSRNFNALLPPTDLFRLCQSLAMLDAIFMPTWDLRYYSFDAHWKSGVEMASMRDGSGDHYHIFFTAAGTVITGFSHESIMAGYPLQSGKPWPGVIDYTPPELLKELLDPALEVVETTFCIWQSRSQGFWTVGPIEFPPRADPDGSEELLSILDGDPTRYQSWAQDYYNNAVPLDLVEAVYGHRPIDRQFLSTFDIRGDLSLLKEDARVIGYPYTL
jgi:hypothetical protein